MQRRSFLKAGSVAGLAATTLVSSSCNLFSGGKKDQEASDNEDIGQFELNEITIGMLQQKMQNKEYTSRAITELYLKRINAIDKAGPKLNAVIQLNPDALDIADGMDKERGNGKVRGPLHGI